ncbi:MAG: thermonuclease family protein [Alphaproteobacteria bacterium]|nr:thermonuclease family protein [Alphaproteobacteria bacterium]
MNRIFVALFCLLLSITAHAVPTSVDYIFDGDTFAGRVALDKDTKITVRVRLINIDTPEIHGECDSEIDAAHRAKARLASLLPVDSVVDLVNVKDDKYLGRIDANVILPDGRDVGDILVREGLARRYSGGGKRAGWCKK